MFDGDDDAPVVCAGQVRPRRPAPRPTHEFGLGRTPSEGVFVPASARAGEDEGCVVQYVYDAARDASDFVILDAADVRKPPVGVVHLPQRVPFGFHGNWIAD